MFRRDVVQRPDEASLDEYERTPIGLFGAAMLRGMGWKDGEAIGGVNKGYASLCPGSKSCTLIFFHPALFLLFSLSLPFLLTVPFIHVLAVYSNGSVFPSLVGRGP